MVSLPQIEQDLILALKAKDSTVANTLRGLKVRIQNEKISKMRDLTDEEIVSLVKSEVKRRKEAAESFVTGLRPEQAEKEHAEASILEKYLPLQMTEQEISTMLDSIIIENNFISTDFGKAMGVFKGRAGQNADSGVAARILKEKLK